MDNQLLTSFVDSLLDIGWFSHAGEPFSEARVVDSLQSGWDGEGKQMLEIWGRQCCAIEMKALETLSDQELEEIFSAVSVAIHEPLYAGMCSYLDRKYGNVGDDEGRKQRSFDEGVFYDVLDSVKRDVSWAGVEHVLRTQGFFSRLMDIFREGRWACSWQGNYPHGQPAVL